MAAEYEKNSMKYSMFFFLLFWGCESCGRNMPAKVASSLVSVQSQGFLQQTI